jgi:hypothetical protein
MKKQTQRIGYFFIFLFFFFFLAVDENIIFKQQHSRPKVGRDRRGRDCIVVGFTITYARNLYHH